MLSVIGLTVMLPTRQGSFRLFRLAGIDVFLHWSWFVVALYEISDRPKEYSSYVWCVFEYLALFGLVLMHEFGHALACRQTGGRANKIVLWPLGGVAYVAPPQRPGAMLWSIAAGPLVNVLLTPVLIGAVVLTGIAGWAESQPNAFLLVHTLCYINVGLLLFNLLPVYPLDGGQILRSVLWFIFGRARSLKFTTIIGFFGVAGLIALAILSRSLWTGIMAAFILMNCWRGLVEARHLAQIARLPRREGFACPACKQGPPIGPIWRCGKCLQPADVFETGPNCPHCGAEFPDIPCLDCGRIYPRHEWAAAPIAPPKI